MSHVSPTHVELLFGRDLACLPICIREGYEQIAFVYWRTKGFPFPQVDRDIIARELHCLSRSTSKDLKQVLKKPSMVGLRLANSFHPQMWSARVRGMSPLQCFNDDRVFRHAIKRASHMWPNRRCWSASSIRMLMALHNRARVSNFRPTVARSIIARFMTNNNQMLDFSAGFGGRLLGALSLPIKYIGIDPAPAQVMGLRKMISTLKNSAPGAGTIVQGCAEEVLPSLPSRSFDLIFSSPPYFNLEKYSNELTQSRIRFPDYSMWRSCFLSTIIFQSHRLLKDGGRLIINVSNSRYPIALDTKAIGSSLFGALEQVFYLHMSTNPADKARSGKLTRQEPIFIFRK